MMAATIIEMLLITSLCGVYTSSGIIIVATNEYSLAVARAAWSN